MTLNVLAWEVARIPSQDLAKGMEKLEREGGEDYRGGEIKMSRVEEEVKEDGKEGKYGATS